MFVPQVRDNTPDERGVGDRLKCLHLLGANYKHLSYPPIITVTHPFTITPPWIV
jgi:hypothetical protein